MAKFEPKPFNLSQINEGNKFNVGDGITPEAINAPIEASAYAQQLAEYSDIVSSSALEKVKELEGQVNGSGKTYPNANIIDNWYFINPINQLDITRFEYLQYGIDRWIGTSGVSLSEFGLHFANESDVIVQKFEDSVKNYLDEKTVTVSLLTSDYNLIYGTFKYSKSIDKQTTVLISSSFHCAITIDGGLLIYAATQNLTLLAVKLEIGATQTLAYMSGGKWILNDAPPNPSLELSKCQRYMVVYKGYSFLGSGVVTNTLCQAYISLPTTMRLSIAKIKKIDSGGNVGFYNGSVTNAVSMEEDAVLSSATAKINITLGTSIGVSTGIIFLDNENVKLIIDANL